MKRTVALMLFLVLLPGFDRADLCAEAPDPVAFAAADRNADGAGREFLLLPSVGVGAGLRVFGASDNGYTGAIERTFDVVLLTHGRFRASMLVDESTYYRERDGERFYPYSIQYQMDYIRLALDYRCCYVALVIDHFCRNIIDRGGDTDPFMVRWYGAGIRWESHGMRTGYRDSAISRGESGMLPPDQAFNYSLYAGKSISTRQFDYDWIFSAALRYDVMQLWNLVPFIEMSARAFMGDERRLDWEAGAGSRIRLESVTLIPGVSYMARRERDPYDERFERSWCAGVRVESLLRDAHGADTLYDVNREPPALALRMAGGYGRVIGGDYYGYRTSMALYADVDAGMLMLTGGAGITHDSSAQRNALFPRYVVYDWSGGVECELPCDLVAAATYRRQDRHDGNDDRGQREMYQAACLSLGDPEMEPGRGVRSGAPSGKLSFPLRVHFKIESGKIVDRCNYPRDWLVKGAMRIDVLRYGCALFGLAGDACAMRGGIDSHTWGVEGDGRLELGYAAILYYRYERQVDLERADGSAERHHLAGVRIEI